MFYCKENQLSDDQFALFGSQGKALKAKGFTVARPRPFKVQPHPVHAEFLIVDRA